MEDWKGVRKKPSRDSEIAPTKKGWHAVGEDLTIIKKVSSAICDRGSLQISGRKIGHEINAKCTHNRLQRLSRRGDVS